MDEFRDYHTEGRKSNIETLVLVFFKTPIAYFDTYILVEKTMENFDILLFTWLLVSEGK